MTTAVQVQYRRGTSSQVAAFTGAQGEVVVDTTNNRVVVQDGATAGGFAAAKLSEVVTNTRTAVSDAAYTVLTTDRTVAYTALSAARVVILPAASSYPTGTILLIVDESGACSGINTITVSRGGSDTLNGTTSFVIACAYGFVKLESNGSNAWTVIGTPAAYITGLAFIARGVQLNATGDTQIPIMLPPGISRWGISAVRLTNPSGSLASGSAKVGVYTAPSQGGTVMSSQQVVAAITATGAATAGAGMALSTNFAANTSYFTSTALYFNVGTANGSNVTVDVVIGINLYT